MRVDDRRRAAFALASCVVAAQAAQRYVPQRVFDAARGHVLRLRGDGRRPRAAPTSSSSASSTTIRTRTGSNWRSSKRSARAAATRSSALEMFERDVQEPLDHFQMGHMDEEEFLKVAAALAALRDRLQAARRLRDREELARRRRQRAAADSPRTSRRAGSTSCSPRRRGPAGVVRARSAVPDRRRVLQAIRGSDGRSSGRAGSGEASIAAARQTLERYYFAQCLKDETMAESIASAYAVGAAGGKSPLVVHFNGAFHSDFGQGTAERAKRRLPGKRDRRRDRAAGGRPRPGRTGRERAEAGGLPRLHDEIKSRFAGTEGRASRLPS